LTNVRKLEVVQKVYELLYRIKSGEENIAKIARETGIPEDRMYKWRERGTKSVTLDDAILLQNYLEPDQSQANSKVQGVHELLNLGKA
jgi:transposase-like protein